MPPQHPGCPSSLLSPRSLAIQLSQGELPPRHVPLLEVLINEGDHWRTGGELSMAMLDGPGNTRYPAALSCKASGTLLHRRMLSKSMFNVIRLATGCLTHRDAKIPAQVTTSPGFLQGVYPGMTGSTTTSLGSCVILFRETLAAHFVCMQDLVSLTLSRLLW